VLDVHAVVEHGEDDLGTAHSDLPGLHRVDVAVERAAAKALIVQVPLENRRRVAHLALGHRPGDRLGPGHETRSAEGVGRIKGGLGLGVSEAEVNRVGGRPLDRGQAMPRRPGLQLIERPGGSQLGADLTQNDDAAAAGLDLIDGVKARAEGRLEAALGPLGA
jgi:hypothetical protein